jgi:hypothetical protein
VGVLLVAAAVLLLLWSTSCAGAEWRATLAVREAGTMTDRTLADVCRQKWETCKPKVAVERDACFKGCADALDSWRKIARPAIDSALIVTVAALQIAEKARAKKPDWVALLKPAVCALARGLAAWGHMLPPATLAAIKGPLDLVAGFTCGDAP